MTHKGRPAARRRGAVALVGAGKKSLAFSLRLRAGDRTLTAAEAADVRECAVAEANRRFGAVLRA